MSSLATVYQGTRASSRGSVEDQMEDSAEHQEPVCQRELRLSEPRGHQHQGQRFPPWTEMPSLRRRLFPGTVKVFVEKRAPTHSRDRRRPLLDRVEIHGDKLDGPSAFFAQRGGRVHGRDAQRLVRAIRFDDEQAAHDFLRLGVRPIGDVCLAAARAKRPPAIQVAKRRRN